MQIKKALDDARVVKSYGISTRKWSDPRKLPPESVSNYNDLINNESLMTGLNPNEIKKQYDSSRKIIHELYQTAQEIALTRSPADINNEARNDTTWSFSKPVKSNAPLTTVAANTLVERMVQRNRAASSATTQQAGYTQAIQQDDDITIKTGNKGNRKAPDSAQQQVTMNFYGGNQNIYIQNSAPEKREVGTSTEAAPPISEGVALYKTAEPEKPRPTELSKPKTQNKSDDSLFVLFGRGSGVNQNPGNQNFREELIKYSLRYVSTKKKKEKSALVGKALQEMLDNEKIVGFKKETIPGSDDWQELDLANEDDLKTIYNKAAQFLRKTSA